MCPGHAKVQSHLPLLEGVQSSVVAGGKNSRGLCPAPLSSQTLMCNSESKDKGLFLIWVSQSEQDNMSKTSGAD